MEEKKNKIICIVGPTASGKTDIAIKLAGALCGEIVSGDSMQIYKGMDIGTAKPTDAERCGIPHYMLDVAKPDEDYSAARYVEAATPIVEDIIKRGKTPIVVGGTGLYIDSLVKGSEFALFEEDKQYRDELFALCEKNGADELHKMLSEVDPERAKQIHPNNVKRVIRALEVYHATGQTISEHDRLTKEQENRFDALYIGLKFDDRQKLYDRINLRVDIMIKNGLEEEAKRILESGVSEKATSMQAIGYKELLPYFRGECSLEAAAEEIKKNSRRYAKRQMTWFNRNQGINWFCVDKSENLFEDLQASINFNAFKVL